MDLIEPTWLLRSNKFYSSLGQAGTSLDLLAGLLAIPVLILSPNFVLHIWVLPKLLSCRYVCLTLRLTKLTTKGLFSTFLWPKYCTTISAWCHRALPPTTFNPPILVGHWKGWAASLALSYYFGSKPYLSRGSYLVQNAIDGVFLPRSPVPSRFWGSDLVLQCRTCF